MSVVSKSLFWKKATFGKAQANPDPHGKWTWKRFFEKYTVL